MSVKLGIYDLFAYTIPGGIFLAALIFVLINHFSLNLGYPGLSLTFIILFGVLSYLLGYVIDAISGRMWRDFFRPKNLLEDTIAKFNNQNPSIKVSLKEMDWYIIFTYIRNQNSEIADNIEKLNVQSKMLKNSGFGTVIFSIIFLVEYFMSGFIAYNLFLCLTCIVVAIILTVQSVKFRRWWYLSIYQSYVGIVAGPDFLPVRLMPKSKTTVKGKPSPSRTKPSSHVRRAGG